MSNFLPLGVRTVLQDTGWTETEIAVYSILLCKGALNLTEIAHETSIGVSTVQYAIKQLILKKMVEKSLKNNKPVYAVTQLHSLQKWLKGYLKQFTAYEDTIGKFIDQYDFNPKLFLTKVRFFEGYRGVKQSYRAILEECQSKEIAGFFSVVEEVGKELQDFFVKEYVPRRVGKGIRIKNIALESPKSIAYQVRDAKELRETCLISKAFFPANNAEINLYDNCMHFMGFDRSGAFAFIIEDARLVAMLRAIFELLWKHERTVYMTDDRQDLQATMESRSHLYRPNFLEEFRSAKPEYGETKDKETVMRILGHEMMSTYQLPYMKALAEIVTRNGGDILNVGYGLGLIDAQIETYRKSRKLGRHAVIEINAHLAGEARKNKRLDVLEGDWKTVLGSLHGVQFDGIVYDGYPLVPHEMHRDGVAFIEYVSKRNLLKPDGILTFFVDAAQELGTQFTAFLHELGFRKVKVQRVAVEAPDRERQIWRENHFLAPIVQY